MSRKLIWGDFNDNFAVKVYKDSDTGEYVARLFVKKNGKQIAMPDADYFDDDKSSALSTAKHMLTNAVDSGNYVDSYKSNPGERKITQDDINAAQRGLRMLTMSKDELREIIKANNPLNMFAGAVTVAAAKQMLAAKSRVGLFKKNPANKSGVKIVYNKLLGAWYIVRGPYHTPIGGAFSSKAEAQAHIMKKNPAKKKPGKGQTVSEIMGVKKLPVYTVWIKYGSVWRKISKYKSKSTALDVAKFYHLTKPSDSVKVTG